MKHGIDRLREEIFPFERSRLRQIAREFVHGDEQAGLEPGSNAQTLRTLPMQMNSVMIMLNFIVTAGMGYPFWIIAARLFDPTEVGLGSAGLSAMRLCALLATLGIGSAIILLLPNPEHRPSEVLSAAFTLATGTGLLIAAMLLVLSMAFVAEMSVLASSPSYVLTFLILNLVVILASAFDSTFMALRRTDKMLIRSAIQSVAALVILALLGILVDVRGTLVLLWAWTGSVAVSAILGYLDLKRAIPNVRLRPSLSWAPARAVLQLGVPNFILRLALSVPIHLIPLVVVMVLSPAAHAYWRAVWIFGFLVLMVPSASSMALFAEAANRPERLREDTKKCIQISLALGIPLAVGVTLMADIGLGLLGQGYANAGATPLRIMVLAIIPQTFISAYIARQRVINRLLEPTMFSTASSLLSIAGAAVGGALYGLPGVAIAWLGSQCLLGLWAGWRIRSVFAHEPDPAITATTASRLEGLPGPDMPGRSMGG